LAGGRIKTEPLDADLARTHLGGRALATCLHRREVPAAAEPLSGANNLVLATGPLTGTLAPSGSRFAVVAKGLPAGAITAATLGGGFGPELKFAGYDAIVFEGKAPEPVFLWIANGAVELRRAGHLRGRTVTETIKAVAGETSEKAKVCCVGPAGENGVGCAVVAGAHFMAAGGAGIGAVMGLKNLKAVAVRGTTGFRVAAQEEFLAAAGSLRAKVAARPLFCKGLKLHHSVLLAESAQPDAEGAVGTSPTPRGCLGCSTKFSTFLAPDGALNLPMSEGLRTNRSAVPGELDGPITDLGLDVLAARDLLSSLGMTVAQGLGLLGRIARGEEVGEPAAQLSSRPVGAAAAAYVPTDHSGCWVGGYTLMPRFEHHNGSEEGAARAQALAAVADSALLCPFASSILDAVDIGRLLSTATGVNYAAEDVVRMGRQMLKEQLCS
jgi:aldehyde:ferredoxin oxidoreductase